MHSSQATSSLKASPQQGGGANGYAFVIMPEGGSLKSIDLSNDKLYGKNWRIGKMVYKSSTPAVELTGYVNEWYNSMAINPTEYRDVEFHSPYYYRVSDGDDGYTTKYSIPVEKTVVSDSSNLTVDWTDWLPELRDLSMSGNGIGFRWETGYGSSTWGRLADTGMLVGTPRFFVDAWDPNQKYEDLKDKINSNKATDTEKSTWTTIQDNLNGNYRLVPGHSGLYWSDERLFHSRNPYSGYFNAVTVELTEDEYAQASGAVWRNVSPGQSYWSNRDDANTNEDGHENDRYSLRFGMLPESVGAETTIALFKKYKGGEMFSEGSWGYLTIVGVSPMIGDNETYKVSGGNLAYMKINDDAKTLTISLDTRTGVMGQDKMEIFDSEGKTVNNPSGLMIRFKHADQNTKYYGHDSHAVIFPFGM